MWGEAKYLSALSDEKLRHRSLNKFRSISSCCTSIELLSAQFEQSLSSERIEWMYLLMTSDTDGNPHRAERVAEITSWLKSHPVSSIGRTSCDLQVLDTAIVERIEDAVEKAKVTQTLKLQRASLQLLFQKVWTQCLPIHPLYLCLTLTILLLGEEEHQESPCDGQASSPLQGECCLHVCVIT